ncbi:tryptophan synthase subunit alpha [Pseudogemmatithrix spongiicola]|uniref:Tryptophan synthase alpha chain n=1 Tax=Pseudogemmatithrix spongiicola TaxID=3062599 RepID=A0AA49Q4X9_9BACT|nr:tryptophan synthase subunit alpha [Gemmatimonadaceae bacterium 'strain 138']WKW15219.1 tryptophan synthase subunit alpha [Gemmatimonadaceae bacterium 'strain 318']
MLTDRMRALRAEGRRALVCYVTAGHPTPADSVRLIRELPAAGCDVLEVGIPFSDPLADGPIIQGSSQRALAQGVTLERALAIIAEARPAAPVVLFSYLNPLMKAGPGVLQRAHDAGVSGVLVTDLPVAADPEREAWLGGGPLEFVRLVAPTTPRERMAEIAKHGSGFVYLISRLGVTGVHQGVAADLGETIARLRSVCDLPICVGFGISTPEQARSVATLADGVVVGSALVQTLEQQGVDAALALVRDIRAALDAR